MSGTSQDRPEVHVSGTKIPYLTDWLYSVTVDGVLKDKINSRRRWTPQELFDVQRYYTEALTGYIFSGEHLEGWTPPGPPEPKPRPVRRRRVVRRGEWRR
jgi:hypothetical protein